MAILRSGNAKSNRQRRRGFCGWRVVLLSAALIGGGLLAGLAVALAVDAAFAFVAAHTSLSLGLFLGFCLGFAVGLVALVLWGACRVSGKSADSGN